MSALKKKEIYFKTIASQSSLKSFDSSNSKNLSFDFGDKMKF